MEAWARALGNDGHEHGLEGMGMGLKAWDKVALGGARCCSGAGSWMI